MGCYKCVTNNKKAVENSTAFYIFFAYLLLFLLYFGSWNYFLNWSIAQVSSAQLYCVMYSPKKFGLPVCK